MDVVQVICYRLWNGVLDILRLIGIALTMPLYGYDSSESARDIDTAATVFKGTYRQAVEDVKRDPKKTLLLFFHSPKHPDSKLVKRQILQAPSFAEYVSDLPLLLFPVSIESFCGWQLGFSYYIVTVPCFVLVKRGNTQLTVAGRCNGVVDVQSVLMLLREHKAVPPASPPQSLAFSDTISEEADDELAFNNHTGSASNVSSTSSIHTAGTLQQQQQSDYEASLAKDRAKELHRREQDAQVERERLLEEQYKEERRVLVDKAQQLLNAHEEPQEDGARLAVQLPDGRKISRRFNPQNPTALLYAFVDVHYLPKRDAFTDYRLQSLHPMFHVSREGTLGDHRPHLTDAQHKLYVDLAPVGGTEESGGAESDAENSSD